MTELQLLHTAQVDPAALAAARTLVDVAFGSGFSDEDWEHGLGGMHALLWEDGDLVGHGSVVQRRLLHGGRALRAGYLEGVAVRAARRGRGHGRTLMGALEGVVRGAYELGALSATGGAVPFYRALGWRVWEGPTSALTPAGIERTEDDDGGVWVLPVSAELDLAGELTCDWRDGDVW
jgi:aminoglycoside 2'-N-acetyltransferase I